MKALLTSLILSPLALFAHSGHPGAANHGTETHLLMGLIVAVPALLIVSAISLRARKKAAVKVKTQD
ncbi:hypothetical protein P3T73_03245 [Kiritimatiellota bacterium B12222]|nr:hypothetical protein P3T73_03245 [Kiritimatiellota bacterium B12222]